MRGLVDIGAITVNISVCIREIIQLLLESKKIGLEFYDTLSEVTRETRAGNVFRQIRLEEKEHLEELERLSETVSSCHLSKTYPEEYCRYLKALKDGRIFSDEHTGRQMARNTWDAAAAAQLASAFEREVMILLYELLRLVPETGRAAVDRLLEEEQRHLSLLQAVVLDRQS